MNKHNGYNIGLVQMAMSRDVGDNLERAVAKVEQSAKMGAQVICLPELFRSQYFCQVENAALFDLAEPIPGPTCERLGKIARERGVVIIASLFERRAPGLYHNTAVILGTDGAIAGMYRKTHIPDDPGFYEKYYFTPGDLGFCAVDTAFGRVGVLVCWDQWYPEAARLTALRGAEVIFYPTAIGWHPAEKAQYGHGQRDAWMTVQRGHAIANGVYVAAVNRIGHETPVDGGAGLEFWGSSFVANPFGAIVTEGSTDKEEILMARVELEKVETTRRNWPFLRDRRIDIYGDIVKRFVE